MIKQRIIVNRRYWRVYVYYDVSSEDTNEIVNKMTEINLPSEYSTSAYTILKKDKLNCGLTYSNTQNQTSVVIIGKTNNASEFVNSFVHEIAHLTNHIARAYKLNLNTEEVCYIAGDISQQMFKVCHTLMCDCCRKE